MSVKHQYILDQAFIASWSDLPPTLWREVQSAALNHRGGPDLLKDLESAMTSGALTRVYLANDARGAVGLLLELTRDVPTIGLIFVQVPHRRRGVARSMISAALGDHRGKWDGWSLPGDRATKSLYESLGHKARLLTMSGEREPDGA